MKSLSIDSHSFFSPLVTPSYVARDARPSVVRPNLAPRQPKPAQKSVPARFTLVEDHVSGGFSLGLITFTLPAVGYAIYHLWHLVGGDTLNQAVRAFAP